jgi:multidrug resistance protein MdtO
VTLLPFLRRELAPTPGRLRASLRIVVASLVAVLVTVVLGEDSFPHGHWAITTIFTVSQADAGASLRKSVQRVVGTLVGGGLGILVVIAFADQPALYMPLLGMIVALGIFASLTTSAPYVMLLGSFTFVLVTFFPPGANESSAVEQGLWRVVAIAVGVICGTGAQLFLWPVDPETKLREALAARLRSVATVMHALGAREDRGDDAPPMPTLASDDLTVELDLLANAEALHPSLRQSHTEQLTLIVEADRLMTTAVWLLSASREWSVAPGGELLRGVQALGDECKRLAEALAAGRPPAPLPPSELEALEKDGGVAGLRPALEDTRLSLRRVRDAAGFLHPDRPVVASALDAPARTPLLTPAFSLKNTEAIALSFKAALGLELCYLLMHGLAWAPLVTAGVTTVLVSLTSFGAIIQKSMLRLGGAILGGALGILTIVVAMPNMSSIGSLLIVAGLGFGVAAWITVGSSRISYMGFQMGMAFAMCVTDPSGPTTDLTTGRDRVLGILIGVVAMLLINATLWPARARLAMWAPLGRALRSLAELARLAPETREYRAQLDHAVRSRSSVYTELAATLRLSNEAALEPDEREGRIEREWVKRLTVRAQAVFLAVLALIRHRVSPGFPILPAPVQEAMRELDHGVGEVLDALADRLDRRRGRPLPDLTRQLDALEALVPHGEEGLSAHDGATLLRRAERDHVAIARSVVHEVELLRSEVDSALAVRPLRP